MGPRHESTHERPKWFRRGFQNGVVKGGIGGGTGNVTAKRTRRSNEKWGSDGSPIHPWTPLAPRGGAFRERFPAFSRIQLELAQEHVELHGIHLAAAELRTAKVLLDAHETVIRMLAGDLTDQILVREDRLAPLERGGVET